MKKSTKVLRWCSVAFFTLMVLGAIGNGWFISVPFFLLGVAISVPIKPLDELRSKFKYNKIVSIVLAVALLIVGSLVATPSSDKTDIKDSIITSTVTSDQPKDETTRVSTESTKAETTETTKAETTISTTETTVTTETTKAETTKAETTTQTTVGTGSAAPVSLSSIPAYSGSPYIVINNNVPNFSSSELQTTGYEKYSDLDYLGRTGVAIASVGKDTMPKEGEKRGDISSIKPTGWVQAQYDCVSGGWLYNRCHLIGWQLSAENANRSNLITGTKYLNINGMLPFENMVADYIKETNNHVAYRITPIYDGNNLLASGVQMEAYSVEDNGEGIQFNVYCYNVQPEVTIDYSTGSNTGPISAPVNNDTPQNNTPSNNTPATPNSQTVYRTPTGKRYHLDPDCGGKNSYEVTIDQATAAGLTPCKKCAS